MHDSSIWDLYILVRKKANMQSLGDYRMVRRSRKRGRKRDGDGVLAGRQLIPVCRLGLCECLTPETVSLICVHLSKCHFKEITLLLLPLWFHHPAVVFVSFFNHFLLSIVHFPPSSPPLSLSLSVPPFLSLSLFPPLVQQGPTFPEQGGLWWNVCCRLSHGVRRPSLPGGSRERRRERRMSQIGQGVTCREREVESKRTTSKADWSRHNFPLSPSSVHVHTFISLD